MQRNFLKKTVKRFSIVLRGSTSTGNRKMTRKKKSEFYLMNTSYIFKENAAVRSVTTIVLTVPNFENILEHAGDHLAKFS
jgi:hypothetical protein